ncbi:MAG: 3-hydroxyacyl-CoA dehydrogenase/enoyl-CoA hydratase family protein [Fimbriimonadaceae bacterium]|nr:3-hydroxyacyl-CoA dehydrogenase/enoyl-CoA hydratase family protein [Fimbriimonadaceae bacterium]
MVQQLGERRKVCVLGAGTMGSGIAAHLANLGFTVTLLDLDPSSAAEAFERAKRARPPHFYVPETADTVTLGGIGDLERHVEGSDWVCEAIIEKPDAKRELLARLEPCLPAGAFVSTNTSGLEIGMLAEGLGDDFKRRFLGTHFFNPPRHLKLLELIPTSETDPEIVTATTRFLEREVARRVVVAKDTPGFIANRYGMWCMYHAIHVAERLALSIEDVDELTGPLLGRPRSGSFRLNDLVGLDIMQDIAQNLVSRCTHDPHMETLEPPSSLDYLLEKGWIGNKTGQGYYRKENKDFFAFDLMNHGYRMTRKPDFPSLAAIAKLPLEERVKAALALQDDAGEFLRRYLIPALDYATYLGKEISHSPEDFDHVMMWGFGWEVGPFRLRDMLGAGESRYYSVKGVAGWDGKVHKASKPAEYRSVGDFKVVEEHEGFRVRSMEGGVRLLSTTTKLGVFSLPLIRSLTTWLQESKPGPIVLASEDRAFSAGFDLKFLLECSERSDWDALEQGLIDLQGLGLLLAEWPSVSAVTGYCLGGGFEMATSCAVMVASAEAQIALPEVKVGLIPGGGGTSLLRLRHQGSAKDLVEVALLLAQGTFSANAVEARKLGYLRETDLVSYHPDRLLEDARQAALTVEPRPLPEWESVAGPVIGMIEQALNDLRKKGDLTDHDLSVCEQTKAILGKATSFEDALARERLAFRHLLAQGLTVARVRHMIETGKPLRN